MTKIPQFKSFVGPSDYKALEKVFENNYIAEGPFAKEFHDKLLSITNSKYGCFASNGTLAIYLALKSLGIVPGDEIIVQNITFIATANAVEMIGATPVFVDIVSFNDLTIDLNKIKITPRTKGIIIAHLFGTACSNIEEIVSFCKNNNLILIEDAAQALGIKNTEGHCGTFGKIGTFSFYADKTITTAEGGFVITNDEALNDRLTFLRNQGRKKSGTFIHPEIGYNFRMTDMQAALGLAQLEKLDYIIAYKQNLFNLYKHYLGDRVTLLKIREDFSYIPFRVVVFVDNAERVMKYMEEKNIEPRSVFYPLHKQPCYQHFNLPDNDFANSIECFNKGICLPTWVGLEEEQVKYISDTLIEAL